MTRCCCLACIEGFGRCSSAPKPDPQRWTPSPEFLNLSRDLWLHGRGDIVIDGQYMGTITREMPPDETKTTYILNRDYAYWNLAEPHTEEAI